LGMPPGMPQALTYVEKVGMLAATDSSTYV
jgi:hypothetical protein